MSVKYRNKIVLKTSIFNNSVPTIDSITISPNSYILDRETFTGVISNDIPIGQIEISFSDAIDKTSINDFILIKDNNNNVIPYSDISLSQFYSSDSGKTWIGSMHILNYELYYFNSTLFVSYNNLDKSYNFNVDTVSAYTYSNKLTGPNNQVLIAYYRNCYEIKSSNGKIYYKFDTNLISNANTCAIFGINEKKYENIPTNSNFSIPIGYNSNYELYDNNSSIIASNGNSNVIGNLETSRYNFVSRVGFITFSVTEEPYSESLISIIKDILTIWTSMVNKPDISKFENENDYNNYALHIYFNIIYFETSSDYTMNSNINENYGSVFGLMFPKTSTINISKSYIESIVDSNSNTINDNNNINSIKNLLKRSIGNALGIGHYWYFPSSPISYDILNKSYYSGTNGVKKYIELFSSIYVFDNKLFGIPIEDYESNSIFMEEGNEFIYNKQILLNGYTHPGLDKEIMTKWIDRGNNVPISIVSLGLLEDIGYDVYYDNVDYYYPNSVAGKVYEIYIDYNPEVNMFARLTEKIIKLKDKYYIIMPSNSSQTDLNTMFEQYIETIIHNENAKKILELMIIFSSNIDLSLDTFDDKNGQEVNILYNISNETSISTTNKKVYKFTTILHDDNIITALMDKQLNI